MLSLALVIAFGGMARGSYDSIVDWMSTALNPDLFVIPSENISVRTFRFPGAMGPEIAAVPGVSRVQMVRDARVVFRRTPVLLVAVELESVGQTAPRPPVAGDPHEMYRLAAAGQGLIVSDNLAQLQGLSLDEARNLLIHAFAGDVLNKMPLEPLRTRVEAVLLQQLSRAGRPGRS